MDVIARSATRRAHVLLVEVPGQWRTRALVERAVLTRGWSLAVSPADADVLAVCGRPRPQLEKAIEMVWHQMPGPRVRVDLAGDAPAEQTLDQAQARLLDTEHHRHDADSRPVAADLLSASEAHDHGSMDHGDGGDGSMDHGDGGDGSMNHGDGGAGSMNHGGGDESDDIGMDHGSMDHGGHGGHGGMEMAPGGIALAEGGEDRDGLEMDVLNVRLGPLLPHWSAGLVLRCALQGDVIAEVQAEILDARTQERDAGPTIGLAAGPARTVDNTVSLLALAGWEDAAAEARRVRDALLEDGDRGAFAVKLDRLRAKVTRSRVLRWSLRGIRPLGREELERHGLPPHLGGDTYDRLLGMLERASDENGKPAPPLPLDKFPHLVTGLDLAAARLVIASLDVHELQPSHVHDETSRA